MPIETPATGNREDRRIIEQVTAFMDVNALSMRFSDWNAQTTNQNHAGYRKQEGSIDEYWIIPVTFENEVCKGYSLHKVCEVLHNHEWLKKPITADGNTSANATALQADSMF